MSWQAELARMNREDKIRAEKLSAALDEMGIGHKEIKSGSVFSQYSILPKPDEQYQLSINLEGTNILVWKHCEHYRLSVVGKLDLSLPVAKRKKQLQKFIKTNPVPCSDMCDDEDDDEYDDDDDEYYD